MIKRTIFTLTVAASSLLLLAALQSEKARTPDAAMGLSQTSVFDTPAPELTRTNTTDPGERPVAARGFPEQPPVVPHGVVDFLPITLTENQCVECHAVGEKNEGDPTPIPQSHYVDMRNAPEDTQDTVVGARYNCMSCHVSPGDNKALVGNVFGQ